MGVIIDSSVIIAAERRRETPTRVAELVEAAAGDEETALSSVGLTELVHGIYRAPTMAIRVAREAFLEELLIGFTVYPYTTETAMIAGKIDGEQRKWASLFRSAIC